MSFPVGFVVSDPCCLCSGSFPSSLSGTGGVVRDPLPSDIQGVRLPTSPELQSRILILILEL